MDPWINPDSFEFSTPVAGGRVHGYCYEVGTYHYNWHDDVELFMIVTGTAEVATRGERIVVKPGEPVILNSNQGHATLALEPGTTAGVIHLGPGVFGAELPSFATKTHFSTYALRARCARLLIRGGDSYSDHLRTAGDAALLGAEILETFPIEGRSESIHSEYDLREVCTYIEKHFRTRLTLAEIARVAGYSEAYLSTLFTQTMGMTCFDYINRVRLREATRALAHTDERIIDVALDSGFGDAKALSTTFKKAFGLTPSAYREAAAAQPEARKVDPGFKKQYVHRWRDDIYSQLAQWNSSREESAADLAARLAFMLRTDEG
ncbi:helix-turn-helix transcriptional regulator [Corynebacterium renale]|uniref:AraC-like DNA-binding protein n=1 Tax=Corynebacterium renale TaxID=1724 RepID=A0A2A9DNM1_9CORY|nr:AraC family transcriptional regulator [Corynebacterium renale]PFG28193.1 AraC-like DNA-binding protein [Corynebacterium renale]SQI20045.1 HTH-type transcriptional regulator [Corynebacterium renale]